MFIVLYEQQNLSSVRSGMSDIREGIKAVRDMPLLTELCILFSTASIIFMDGRSGPLWDNELAAGSVLV